MATHPNGKRGEASASGGTTRGKAGKATPWVTSPGYVEYSDGRYRVDYDWLHARLSEIAEGLGIPRTGNQLALALLALRCERLARTDHPCSGRERPPTSIINEIGGRRTRPTEETLDDLAELARRAGIEHTDRQEWRRRGGRELWDAPDLFTDEDEYAPLGRSFADMARLTGTPIEEVRRYLAGWRGYTREGQEERKRTETHERTQPGRANGTMVHVPE